MIIVKASMKIKEGKKAELVNAASACVAETVKEDGCISYELFLSPDGGSAVIFEEWGGQEALDAHVKTPHFAAFVKAIDGLLDGEIAVKSFEAKQL